MSIKSKITYFIRFIAEQSLMSFYLSLLFESILLRIMKVDYTVIDSEVFFYTGIACGFLAFFTWIKRTPSSRWIKATLVHFSRTSFFITLIICIGAVIFPEIFADNFYISSFFRILCIITGTIVFYEYRSSSVHLANKAEVEKIEHTEPLALKKSSFKINVYLKRDNIILAAITLVGFFIRYKNLSNLSLWGDEGTVYIAAKNILNTGLPYLESGTLYLRDLPHLYISALFLKFISNTEIALRLPSVLAGTILIPVCYLTAKRMMTLRMSILVSIIIAFHPWMVEYSRIGRSYILVVLLILLSFYFVLRTLQTDKNSNLIGFTIVSIISIFTHQTGQVVLLFIIPLVFTTWNKYCPFNLYSLKKLLQRCLYFVPVLIAIVLSKFISSFGYYLKLDQTIIKANSIQQGNIIEKIISFLPFDTLNTANTFFFLKPIPVLAGVTCLTIAINSLFYKQITKEYKLLQVTFFTFMAVLTVSKEEVSINRGVLFLFPFCVLLSIYFLQEFLTIYNLNKVSKVSVILLAIITANLIYESTLITFAQYNDSIFPFHSAFEGFVYRQDNKTTYQYVNTHYKTGDIVIVYGVPQFSSVYANFKVDYRIWSGSTATIQGKNVYTNVQEIDDTETIKRIIENNPRVWLITSYSIFSGTEKAPRIFHINQKLIEQLNAYSNKIVYQSQDPGARVYSFVR